MERHCSARMKDVKSGKPESYLSGKNLDFALPWQLVSCSVKGHMFDVSAVNSDSYEVSKNKCMTTKRVDKRPLRNIEVAARSRSFTHPPDLLRQAQACGRTRPSWSPSASDDLLPPARRSTLPSNKFSLGAMLMGRPQPVRIFRPSFTHCDVHQLADFVLS